MSEQDNGLTADEAQSSSGTEDVVETLSEDAGAVIATERKPLNRSTIVTFVVLVLGAAGVWYMYQRAGPKAASAAIDTNETKEAKQTISKFLSGGQTSIKLMESMLRNTQKVVEQFLSYPSMTQVPLSELQTNPFRLKPETPTAVDDGSATDRRRREEERNSARKAAENLQLQSIMYGEARKGCMISGGLYVEGQQVERFTIEKINPTSVIVRSGPHRFELKTQK